MVAVIVTEFSHPMSPMIDTKVYFGVEAVTINMQWAQEIHPEGYFVSYSVNVLPVIDVTITMINNTRLAANLILSYNTPYSVSVVADLCGQSNVTTLTEIIYGE